MRVVDWDAAEFADLDVDALLQTVTASAAHFAFEEGDGVVPENVGEVQEGAPFIIPLLIPEELESGDGRKMEKGALSTRNLPITLLWQPATGDGHNGSYVVGRIDTIEEVEGGLGNARGVFDTGPYGREAERLVRAKMLRGVSADLDMFEATVDEDGSELAEDFDPNTIKNEKMTVKKARVMAATLVAKPAFQECTIELVSEDNMNEDTPITDGVYEETPPASDSAEYALSTIIASAAPVNPPSEWFVDPQLDGPTPLTVTDDGRVFGHIATWDTDHVGLSNGVRPPRSRSNYAYFRTGLVKTIEGEDIAVGQLTLLGGHAPLDATAQMAVKHYDDTSSAVADVTAGEDQFGIWVSGALRPSVTPEQVRVFRASAPSGDWRPINGYLELVAVCQVNVPGFPVARARVASGSVMALVAAGTATLHKMRRSETEEIQARLASLEERILAQRRAELSANFAPVREQRIARLREAAAQAREKLAPELDRRGLAATQLSADAEAARARFSEFKLMLKPGFKEDLHPRDDHGKFREVIAKLTDLLNGPDSPDSPAAREAKDALEKADNLDKTGDSEGAKKAAEEAKGKLEKAADDAKSAAPEAPTSDGPDGEVSPADGKGASGEALQEVADDVADVVSGNDAEPKVDDAKNPAEDKVDAPAKPDAAPDAAPDAPKDDAGPAPDVDAAIADIPPEIKDLIDTLIDEFGENVDPKTIISRLDNQAKHWLEGKGFESPEDMAKVIEKMMQRPIQPDIGQ